MNKKLCFLRFSLSRALKFVACFAVFVACKTQNPEKLKISETILKGESIPWANLNGSVMPGLYAGYFSSSKGDKVFPAEINLIPYREAGDVIKSRMILTVLQESFQSPEYSSEYYPLVDINTLDGRINIKNKSQVAMNNMKIEGRIISGDFDVRGTKGSFILKWTNDKAPLVKESSAGITNKISGQYQSECRGQPLILDVKTTKTSYKKSVPKFLNLPVTASVYGRGTRSCAGLSGLCAKFEGRRAHADLLTGSVRFSNDDSEPSCQFSAANDLISCLGCEFKKTDANTFESQQLSSHDLDLGRNLINTTTFRNSVGVDDFVGNYRGFITNSQLGFSQPIALSVNQKKIANRTYVFGTAKHYWQNEINDSYTAYSFQKRRFVEGRTVFVFDGKNDGLFYVTGFYENGLVGKWYSKSSGYLGQVHLVKGIPWAKLPVSKASSLLDERCAANDSLLRLKVKPASSTSPHDFFPNKLFGYSRNKGNRNLNSHFLGGVFDRRSGYVGLLKTNRSLSTGLITASGVQLLEDPSYLDLAKNKLRVVNVYKKKTSVAMTASNSASPKKEENGSEKFEVIEHDLKQARRFERVLKKLEDKSLKSEGKQVL